MIEGEDYRKSHDRRRADSASVCMLIIFTSIAGEHCICHFAFASVRPLCTLCFCDDSINRYAKAHHRDYK